MELNLKLKYILLITILFGGLIFIDWYNDIDYCQTLKETNRYVISYDTHPSIYKDRNLDKGKHFEIKSEDIIQKTKSKIPMIYNTEVIEHGKEYVSDYKM